MNNKTRIENFLSNMLYFAQNGNNVDSRLVYAMLSNQDQTFYKRDLREESNDLNLNNNFVDSYVTQLKASRVDLKSSFKNIVEEFKNSKGFVTDERNDGRLLTYTHKVQGSADYYKLYVPLSLKNINNNIVKLFKYFERHDMSVECKVWTTLRSDEMVIRVPSMKDVHNIVNYIEGYIPESELTLNNPFLYTEKGVGLAKDGKNSYNEQVAINISRFVSFLELERKLDLPNQELITYFSYFLKKNSSIDKKEIIDCIFDVVNGASGIYNYQRSIEGHANVMSDGFEKINKNMELAETQRSLIKVGITNYHKYGREQLFAAMKQFLSTGSAKGFTSTNDTREIISKIGTKKLHEYLDNKFHSDNIFEQIRMFVDYIEKSINKKTIMKNTFNQTHQKHGDKQLNTAINSYLYKGNPYLFTNDNHARDVLVNNISPHEMAEYLSYAKVKEEYLNEEKSR